MDLWSNKPEERLAAARDAATVADWPERIGVTAPVQPWPFGMPCSINPFVLFLGKSPGNSPAPGEKARPNYSLPTAACSHRGLHYPDSRGYWLRIRKLGSIIVKRYAPQMTESDTLALVGQLNLGTGMFGEAKNAPFDPEYCRWVPDVVLDHLKPAYLILVGLNGIRTSNGEFDPNNRFRIDWNRAQKEFPFKAYEPKQYRFRLWNSQRTDPESTTENQWFQRVLSSLDSHKWAVLGTLGIKFGIKKTEAISVSLMLDG